mmetsp:Transcript_19360/g.41646  ORF Transcript_19360/g.41646 Transcript_19360/m.41646 type:complete len:157 (-) Transcript_19360:154-624(-)
MASLAQLIAQAEAEEKAARLVLAAARARYERYSRALERRRERAGRACIMEGDATARRAGSRSQFRLQCGWLHYRRRAPPLPEFTVTPLRAPRDAALQHANRGIATPTVRVQLSELIPEHMPVTAFTSVASASPRASPSAGSSLHEPLLHRRPLPFR